LTDVDLTVLGCAGSHPGVGRLCSGYLVGVGDTRVMLDAGNGATANLQRYMALREIDAVVVSHRHVDHCIDLIGAYYALRFDPEVSRRLPVIAAGQVRETLTGLLSDDSDMGFDDVFDLDEVAGGAVRYLGPLELAFADSVHPPPTVSTRITVDGCVIVYSGDSAGGDELVEVAREADLFLCEATWTGDADDHPPGVHLTARGAAEVASAAGVGRLVLTHVAGGTDRDRVLEEASEVFDGQVEMADDLTVYTVG